MPTFNELLTDPNLINLFAGFGARIDPQGVGGALGPAVQQYTKANVAAKRADVQEKAQTAQNKMLLDILNKWGPITPKGQQGPTSISATDTGIKAEIDGPPLQGPTESGEVIAAPPPAQPVVAPQPDGSQTNLGTGDINQRLALLRPFLSALLGAQVP